MERLSLVLDCQPPNPMLPFKGRLLETYQTFPCGGLSCFLVWINGLLTAAPASPASHINSAAFTVSFLPHQAFPIPKVYSRNLNKTYSPINHESIFRCWCLKDIYFWFQESPIKTHRGRLATFGWHCFLEHKFFFCLTGRHSASLTQLMPEPQWRKHNIGGSTDREGAPGLLQLGWHRHLQHP